MKLNLHLTNKLVTPEEEDEQRYPWAYNKKTKWNDRMKKRAIIWLSQRVGKPVLKLTALDYEKNSNSRCLPFGSHKPLVTTPYDRSCRR